MMKPVGIAAIALAITVTGTSAHAAEPNLDAVLAHGAEVEERQRDTIGTTMLASGALFAGGGTILALSRDGERRQVGMSFIAGGGGLVVGTLLGMAISPPTPLGKLHAARQKGVAADAIEIRWEDEAASARKLRRVAGIAGMVIGIGALAGATAIAAASDQWSYSARSTAAALAGFGFVEFLLGGVTLATRTEVETSWDTYRLSKPAAATVQPTLVGVDRGLGIGLGGAF